MHALKLTQIGNSVGMILPRELLAKLGMTKGDTIYAVDQPDGVRLTVANPDFAAQMDVARKVMKDRRAVLRELAK
jgi:putative addiction module antidote